MSYPLLTCLTICAFVVLGCGAALAAAWVGYCRARDAQGPVWIGPRVRER